MPLNLRYIYGTGTDLRIDLPKIVMRPLGLQNIHMYTHVAKGRVLVLMMVDQNPGRL